jgi:ATP-dependent Clp protease ATP-binding subunit ClpC
MFSRFTERARRVVFLSHGEATALNHDHIGTEHLLLALLREGEGVAATVLAGLGASLDRVHPRLVEVTGYGRDPYVGHLPLTARVRTVLDLSRSEATKLGHRGVSTEHLLLGLVREGRSAAALVLLTLGVNHDRVAEAVVSRRDHGVTPRPRPAEWDAPTMELPIGSPELDARLATLRALKAAAVDEQDFERAARLRSEERDLLRRWRMHPN